MLSRFFKFFCMDDDFETNNLYEDFGKRYSTKSFGGGLFNVMDYDKRSYWNELIGEFFPSYKDNIAVIGYDWLGRVFATLKDQDCIKLFEIGTGEVLNIGCTMENLLEEEIPVYADDALAYKFYKEWKKNNSEDIPYGKCVGYKVPLFLGGKDDLSNLELSDLDVYWNVVGPMLRR